MMMKKLLTVVLAAVMVLPAVCAYASYWDEGNDGNSWETAYVIDSAEDFVMIGERYEADAGKYFKLTTDIDLTNSEVNFPFKGHFDGQNHTLKINVQETWGYDVALFSEVTTDGIAIRNLNVEGNVRAYHNAGGIVVRLQQGTIENCSFTGTVKAIYDYDPKDYDEVYAGGIVAITRLRQSNEPLLYVRNCTFSGTVKASTINGDGDTMAAGGIVGYGNYISIENCTTQNGSEISITGSAGETYIGGILGMGTFTHEPDWTNEVSLSGNTWPSQYPEIGNATGSTTNTPDYTNYTPDYGYENPGEGYSGYPDYTSGGSSGSGGGCNSSTASILLAAVLAVKFCKR